MNPSVELPVQEPPEELPAFLEEIDPNSPLPPHFTQMHLRELLALGQQETLGADLAAVVNAARGSAKPPKAAA